MSAALTDSRAGRNLTLCGPPRPSAVIFSFLVETATANLFRAFP